MTQAAAHAKLTPYGARQGLTGVAAEANLIPKVDKDGIIQGVAVPDATVAVKGKVLLAVHSGTVPGTVVQATDPRLTPAGIDHGGLAGLGDDDHPQYFLLAGQAGGQTAAGGVGPGDPLNILATTDGGGGDVIVSTSPFLEAFRVLSSGEVIINDTVLAASERLRINGNVYIDGDLHALGSVVGGFVPGKELRLVATEDPTVGPVIFQGDPTSEYGRFEDTQGTLLINLPAPYGSEMLAVGGNAYIDGTATIPAGVYGGVNPADELLLAATSDAITGGRIRFVMDGSGSEYARFVTDNGGALLLGVTAVSGSENFYLVGEALFDGNIGFYGAVPVAQPAAYTQTYATATRTHDARTAAALTDNIGGAVAATLDAIPDPADSPVTADDLRDDLVANALPEIRDALSTLADQLNKLLTDQNNTAQLLNSLIDDLQATGLLA